MNSELRTQLLNWLLRSVPAEFRKRDELEQQISVFCEEAIDIYDPSKGIEFSTFLIQHVRQRCSSIQQYLWNRSKRKA